MDFTMNPKVNEIFNSYPETIREKLKFLRQLILETASETEDVTQLEETLKWGEPSYVTKHGSTIRMNQKKSVPGQYAMYFTCTTGLVSTFNVIYRDTFSFEGNRAIVFNVSDEVPVTALKHCISTALRYKKVRHLPLLGM